MTKVIGMLVALAMFCAMPAVAFAQEGNNVDGENNANIDQDGTGGDGGGAAGGDGGEDGDGGDAQGGDGGDVGNQAAINQCVAGEDCNQSIDQSQSFGGDTTVNEGGDVVSGDSDNVGFRDDDDVVARGGGSVQSVRLARTGFDAWVLALVGGVSLAGGLGLLAAQRRGKLHG